jgi:hypothetical protein
MKIYYRIIILAISMHCSLALDSKPLLATKCVYKKYSTLGEERSQSSAIFAGKVINEENDLGYVVFQVSKVWKGSPRKIIEISKDNNCNPDIFKINNEYLVYAVTGVDSDNEKYLDNILGSRTRLLAKAGSDLKVLGIGQVPSINNTPTPTKSSSASPTPTQQTIKPSSSSNTDAETPLSPKQRSSSESSSLPIIIATITGSVTSIIAFYMLKNRNNKPK